MIDMTNYRSPDSEESFFKNIPIEHLEEVQAHFRTIVRGLRYVFRGPRSGSMDSYCLKRNAKTFAIYKASWA
jgi:hypothetical protein